MSFCVHFFCEHSKNSIIFVSEKNIEFTVTTVETETVITVCNILELSNHYK